MNLPDQYTYISIRKDNEEEIYRVKELNSESEAELWLEEFSQQSYVTWRVLKTYPNAGRKNVFRKDYRCQHSTDKRATGAGPSKNTDCPAKLHITIKRYVENSRAKTNDDLSKEYPATVTLKGKHNHPILSADILRHRDMAAETREKLATLFRQGHSASTAHYLLKLDLMVNHPDDYYKIAADGRYLPTVSVVSKLFQEEFVSEYGSFKGEDMFTHLQSFLMQYESSGGKAQYKKTSCQKHYYVVIITPIMLRVHENVSQSGDTVMLDASGGMDKEKHRLYAFVAPTAAGGLPLGIIITDCEKEAVFTEALLCYKEMLSEKAFFSNMYPKVFLTDNDMKERNALNRVFPQSSLLLCQFHMLKSMWSWLCSKNHAIDTGHRQELYFLFKNIVYSFDEVSAAETSSLFLNEAKKLGYENLSKYFLYLWDFRKDWVSCYRKHLETRGNNTTNYVEIVFRILKDIIFDRFLAYNIIQLVDYIVTKYEMYMRQRLVDFSNGRYSSTLLIKMLPNKCDLSVTSVEHEKEDGNFKVKYLNDFYIVDMIRGICSCSVGSCGKMCKHASAVFLSLEHSSTAFNIANSETKALMLFVAEGIKVTAEWFEPLHSNSNQARKASVEPPFEGNAEKNDDSQSMETYDEISHETNVMPSITEEDNNKFLNLISRIQEGLSSNPTVFVPAFKKMLKNAEEFASTESGLISAMHTFGTYSGVKSATQRAAKHLIRRSHKTVIGVQPTAIARRKFPLSGRKKINVGRPTGIKKLPKELSHHKYTSFGMLPKRKRKAPHNLEQCVYDNMSLGGRKKN